LNYVVYHPQTGGSPTRLYVGKPGLFYFFSLDLILVFNFCLDVYRVLYLVLKVVFLSAYLTVFVYLNFSFLTAWRGRYSFTAQCFLFSFFFQLFCFRNAQKFAEILQIYIPTMYRLHFFELFFGLEETII